MLFDFFFLCASPYFLFSTMCMNHFSNYKRGTSYNTCEAAPTLKVPLESARPGLASQLSALL